MSQGKVTRLFSAGDVARLARISYRQLNHWVDQRLIVPAKDSSGTGDHRRFDFQNLVEARVIGELRDRGLSLQKVRRCLRFLREHLPTGARPLAEELLLTDGTTIYWCRNAQEVVDTLKHGQMVFAIAIADLWNQLQREVYEMMGPEEQQERVKSEEIA